MSGLNLEVPVIGILRGVEGDFFGEVMAASFSAGLQAIEVTMNTHCAPEIVERNLPHVPEGKLLGMGTIRNLKEAEVAVQAGAMFLVTPNLDFEVITYAKSVSVPIVSGALTPTEVYAAWQAGADLVKVFPCNVVGGAHYIKELLGPFDHVPITAVGGVTRDNLADYFAAGVNSVGVSSALFGRRALAEKKINELTNNVKDFIGKLHCIIDQS